MENWRERMEQLEPRLQAWDRECAREFARLRKERRRRFRKLDARTEAELAAEARRRTGEDLLRELFLFFDELGDAYLAEKLPQVRANMRAQIGMHDALFRALWSYAEQQPELIQGPADDRRLRLALAAVSLDDLRVDVKLLHALLGRLYLAAARAGVDPDSRFAAVAAVSNPSTGGGGARMQQFLEGFRDSLYFKERVQRELPRVRR